MALDEGRRFGAYLVSSVLRYQIQVVLGEIAVLACKEIYCVRPAHVNHRNGVLALLEAPLDFTTNTLDHSARSDVVMESTIGLLGLGNWRFLLLRIIGFRLVQRPLNLVKISNLVHADKGFCHTVDKILPYHISRVRPLLI